MDGTRCQSSSLPGERRIRLLAVDDDETICQLLQQTLEESGDFEVRTCTEGSRALAEALAFRPDVIILDIHMPDKDGTEIAAELREEKTTRAIPIVFLTGIVSAAELGSSGENGSGPLICPKPFDRIKLLKLVRKALAGRR